METEQAMQLVREDVMAGVGSWFPGSDDLEITLAGGVEGSPFTTIRWVHRGRNSSNRDPFIGLARTGIDVEVHGITLVEDRGAEEPLFHRYVDWVGVYDQLGLSVAGRLAVADRPDHLGPGPVTV